MTLSDKSVAVITGAASGIGRAIAVRLGEEQIAAIAISDINEAGLNETASLIERSGAKLTVHKVDVSRFEEVQPFAKEVIAQHGRVTHLINNAGVGLLGTFEQISID